MVLGLLSLASLFAGSLSGPCTTDLDCSLNGVCSNAVCVCDAPWNGTSCSVLQFRPAPTVGAYGESPNVTSWGGTPLLGDEPNTTWHMYVVEIEGAGCGLAQWKAQSTVVHAIASSPEGPYMRVSTVLKHEAHNPAALRHNGSWYIFHIGDGDAPKNVSACTGGEGPPPPAGHVVTKHAIHVSRSGPAGPFVPVPTGSEFIAHGCNNPSPMRHPNGTVYLGCTWSLRRAKQPDLSRWSKAWSIAPKSGRTWLNRSWEDPFLWVDARGNWHVLAHTYTDDVFPALSYSGHGFSTDGHHWHYSTEEPYDGTVRRVDGSTKYYATLERPKLLFTDPAYPFRPTHVINGASPVWDEGAPANPCGACRTPGQCVGCKVTPGMDWTFTLVRPLGGSGVAKVAAADSALF